MKLALRLLLVALLLTGAGLALRHWLQGPAVTIARIERGDIAEVVYATGIVEPVTWSKVVPLQRGRIIEHCGCEGKAVKRGDLLAKLDDTAAQAELRQITAKRDFSVSEVARVSDLITRGASTRLNLERAETDLRQLDGQIAALSARLTDYLLLAPKEGIVLRADGQVGDIATTNDALFWVGQAKPLQVVAEVNEEDIAKVSVGQIALLRNDGFPAGGLSGKVGSVTPKGDPQTKTFRTYLSLTHETPLRIGMSVEANIVVREKKAVLLVPAEAILAPPGGKPGVLLIENGTLRMLPVTPGIKGARLVEIAAEISEGAIVVSPAKPEYKSGMAVRTVTPAPRP